MKTIQKFGFLLTSALFFFSCGSDSNEGFHMDKKYWTADDYNVASYQLADLKNAKKELPNLDNPKTADIFHKIIDTNNISVVVNDNQLGIINRHDFTNNMFTAWKNIRDDYSIIDRTDKYQYPVEFVEVLKFGLYLQPYYINTGNEKIIKDSDNPGAPDVVSILNANKDVLIKNYDIYLDYINYEDRFSDKALNEYADGIKQFFPALITTYAPEGDYSAMLDKISNMEKKCKNPAILGELKNTRELISAKKTK